MSRRRVLAVVLLVSSCTSGIVATGPAAAIDQTEGRPGFCPDATGVTVVVDFQQLGGETYVRCFPSESSGTGLDALQGAGFQVEGVQRWGMSFICRIENRPSAVEAIPVEGTDGYRESCIDTPPAAGYWSYWHAGNNCGWQYSQWGVKNRNFTPGGFEGWSFSLNATADANPVPRIAPVRPGTEGGSCISAPEPAPSTDDPDEQAPGVGGPSQNPGGSGTGSGRGTNGSGGSGRGTSGDDPDVAGGSGDAAGEGSQSDGSSADDGAVPPPLPRERTEAPTGNGEGSSAGGEEVAAELDPANNVAFSSGEDAPDTRDLIREQQGGVWWAPWLAATAVAALAGGMWWTSRRRRLARDG